ncbi:Eukaryotic translation initiation factor 3 subunit 7 (eIF-3) family protein [Babesia bovis T2Bo]|uniref:Eukaryotic translation initiation factor 3 subunit D n=1 Tax=Babesia bovis TaxID=5865 RepID=A7AM33_BABBO|nr:Eukaryotic translation initiation factor 3 subunit 7 (eIF-3) family protein [Babesia bovis T2Bo]EDO07617.1 Eukaryotic translation initiation factor 3 subunit 7 (eIF-3) family protein [Babesia bovis T2Bo]BAN64157.1 eukaryotic translation initiation factor 3 subunit 7, putative [Babesia bovis]|eukprot:XP_001611185.1 eukaryotic translation initiation factor 3 subunit 7 [Babesia bovis T2Bo]
MTRLRIVTNLNASGWGPDESDDQTVVSSLGSLSKLPLEPRLKFDRQLRVCDFTYFTYQKNIRDAGRYGRQPVPVVVDEEMQFQTVDGRSLMKAKNMQHYRRKAVPKQTTQAFNQKQMEEEAMIMSAKQKHPEMRKQRMMHSRGNRPTARHHTFNEWSIEPSHSWHLLSDIPFSQLSKVDLPGKVVGTDVTWRGKLGVYDKRMDHISAKSEVPLQNLNDQFDYYWTSTNDDDCIMDYLLSTQRQESADAGDHIILGATDQILAVLMTAARSKYSWHLNVTKIDNKIIIDKANGSIIDMLTVNETSPEPPLPDAEIKINRPPALGYEAVKVNQCLRQQVLVSGQFSDEFELPPFVEEGDNPSTMAYRYRTFMVPGDNHGHGWSRVPIHVITRGEVHARIPGVSNGGYTYVCALNELPHKTQKSWRIQIETQKGALLANEMRNNTAKMQRFAACAIISGCDTLKLAYVSRRSPGDAEHHSIIGIHTYTTENLAVQMGLNMRNAWAVVRHICALIMDRPDGQYILVKDPLKANIRFYAAPEEEDVEYPSKE